MNLNLLSLKGCVQANSGTFTALLKDCGSVTEGVRIHEQMVKSGYGEDVFLCNVLVKMYGRFGRLDEAYRVFDGMKRRNVFSWNNMVAAFAENGHLLEAVETFNKTPEKNVTSSNVMITVYSEHGRIHDAEELFWKMTDKSTVTWNAMVTAYARNGRGKSALHLFRLMNLEGGEPNRISFITILDACAVSGALSEGRIIHSLVIELGLVTDPVVATTLLSFYGRCGSLEEAVIVFKSLHDPDVVTLNAMVTAYAQNGELFRARKTFDSMKRRSTISWNTMIAAYVQNGFLSQAKQLFDSMPQRSVASWNNLLAGFVQSGRHSESVNLFATMDLEAVRPDKITFISLLEACGSLRDSLTGKDLHEAILSRGLITDVTIRNALVSMHGKSGNIRQASDLFNMIDHRDKDVVLWTTMVAAYASSGELELARATFDQAPEKNVVSWNAMLTAYTLNGESQPALLLFTQMDLEGVLPDDVTFTVVFDACTSLSELSKGRLIRASLENELPVHLTPRVKTAMVNMYGKSGKLEEARAIFETIPVFHRDLVLFSTMIAAYAHNGESELSVELFSCMLVEGVTPTHITFVSILNACSHAGLSKNCGYFFAAMAGDFGIQPGLDHYVCVVDLLGRAGKVEEAQELVNSMPFEPDPVTWRSLLSASKEQSEVQLAQNAAHCLNKMDSNLTTSYVLLSSAFTL